MYKLGIKIVWLLINRVCKNIKRALCAGLVTLENAHTKQFKSMRHLKHED